MNMGAILALGAFLQLLAHALRFWTPPFGVFCTGFALAALGIAYQDSHSNTLVSSVKGAHKWLGYVHACYAFGTLASPFMANGIATVAMRSGRDWTWSLFYLAPMGMGVFNLAFVLFAFRDCLWWSQRVDADRLAQGVSGTTETSADEARPRRTLWETVRLSGVWQSGLFFFFYLGASFSSTGEPGQGVSQPRLVY
jgi:fucose permease